jgi:hypothetical protein
MFVHLGRIRSPEESFAALVAAGRWVTKEERERLREKPFFVLEARPVTTPAARLRRSACLRSSRPGCGVTSGGSSD